MDRRTFLARGAAGVSSLIASSGTSQNVADSLEIIDCHTHFYDPSRPEGVPWPDKGSSLYRTVLPEHLRALPKYRPVSGTVIVEASSRVEDNAWLLELAQEDPFIVGIVGRLEPESPEFENQVKRFAKFPLFRGIRVSVQQLKEMLDQPGLPQLKRLAEHDLALDVNGGPETPGVIAIAAPRIPTLRFVLNHIGNVAVTSDPPSTAWRVSMEQAGRHENVFCKISALVEGASRDGRKAPSELEFYRPYIDVVWNAYGDDRVIYGSNWPVSERAADYATLQRISCQYALDKGPEAAKKFCSLNASRAYQWIRRS